MCVTVESYTAKSCDDLVFDITSQIVNNKFLFIKSIDVVANLPVFDFSFDATKGHLFISHVYSNCIGGGQRFLFKSLCQIINYFDGVRSIEFDWIVREKTRNFFVPVLCGRQSLSSVAANKIRDPFVLALAECGFNELHIIWKGGSDFSILGVRGEVGKWLVDASRSVDKYGSGILKMINFDVVMRPMDDLELKFVFEEINAANLSFRVSPFEAIGAYVESKRAAMFY